MDGCTDGTWHERHYFTCPYGRSFFGPYYNLSPDHRFETSGNVPGAAPAVNRKEYALLLNLIPRTQKESWVGPRRSLICHLLWCAAIKCTCCCSIALYEYPLDEQTDQTVEYNQMVKYLGDGRGIQGHQNSCYLDATVFGLFALSDVFDSMFLGEARDKAGKEIKSILWKGIINPLRR